MERYHQPPAGAQPSIDRPTGEQRSGFGWLVLLPVACCGGPLLIAGLAAAGALAWGGLGFGIAAITAVALVVRQRRHRGCCPPGTDANVRAGTAGHWAR